MANLVTFAKKLWKDKVGGNTPITAAELNRMEGGISDCATQINKLGDSVSRCEKYVTATVKNVRFRQSNNNTTDVIVEVTMSDDSVVTLGFSADKFSYMNSATGTSTKVALSKIA